MSNKKYRLLKEHPYVKIGAIVEKNIQHNDYETTDNREVFPWWLVEDKESGWFQEVVEPEPLFDAAKINERIAQLEIEKKAFNAGRALWAKEFAPPSHQLRYETFEEYKIETHKVEKETTMKDVKKHFGIYTEADIDKARREGFEAGRLMNIGGTITGFMGMGLKFNNYEDYKKSLNK